MLHERIGEGGMAEVWRATERATGRSAAVKVLSAARARQPRMARAVRSEVRVAARLRHPGIVPLYDQGLVRMEEATERLVAGTPWVAMALAEGTLGDRPPIEGDELLDILRQILAALAHAHARDIVHLDLKPANVLRIDGRVVLADFGLARVLGDAQGRGPGIIGGTPGFMAPEQREGRTVGPAADLYALGCTANALAIGVPVPSAFDAWLARLTSPEPEDRFGWAAEARAALDALGPPQEPHRGDTTDSGTEETLSLDDLDTEEVVASPVAPCPIPTLRVPSVRPEAPRVSAAHGLGLFGLREARVMGRSSEQEALWSALGTADAGEVHVVAVEGSGGVGKTRLAMWLARTAHAHAAAWTGRLRPGQPLSALAEALPPPSRTRPWADAFHRMVHGHAEGLPLGERAALVARRLLDASAQRVTVLVLDDLEDSPPGRALVEALAGRRGRVLVVCTGHRLSELPADVRLSLSALSQDAAREMIDELIELDPTSRDVVVVRSGGQPMHALQLLSDRVQRGALERVGRRWRLSGGTGGGDLEGVWERRVAASLEGRSPDDGAALELAALLGDRVSQARWARACAEAALVPADDLLSHLADQGLLTEVVAGTFAFVHGLLREVLERRSRAHERLQALHLACAAVLQDTPARRGHHRLAAGAVREGLQDLCRAAAAHSRDGDPTSCHALVDRIGVEADRHDLPDDDLVRVRVRMLAAASLATIGEVERGVAQAEAVLEPARRAGPEHLAQAQLTLGRQLVQLGRLDEARRALEACLEEIPQGPTRGSALHHLSMVAQRQGDPAAAWTAAERAFRVFEEAGHPGATADPARQLSYLAELAGDLDLASSWCARAEEAARSGGSVALQISVRNERGELARARGDLDAAARYYEEAIAFSEVLPRADVLHPRVNLALLALARGDTEAAAALLAQVRARAEETGRRRLVELVGAFELELHARRGEWESVREGLGRHRRLLTTWADPDLRDMLAEVTRRAEAAGEAALAEDAKALHDEQRKLLSRDADVSPR